jgi:YlmC/YmxH family sporulation protein
VVDIEFDCSCGKIEAIIVPGPGKICGFLGSDSEYVIPFSCIKKIGPDIILVEIKEDKFLKKI